MEAIVYDYLTDLDYRGSLKFHAAKGDERARKALASLSEPIRLDSSERKWLSSYTSPDTGATVWVFEWIRLLPPDGYCTTYWLYREKPSSADMLTAIESVLQSER